MRRKCDSGSDSFRRTLLLSVKRDLGTVKRGGEEALRCNKPPNNWRSIIEPRARLAGISSADLSGAESPGQVLELLVRAMAKGSTEKKPAEQLEVARFLGTSDLRKTVLLQRLVIRAAVSGSRQFVPARRNPPPSILCGAWKQPTPKRKTSSSSFTTVKQPL